MNKVKIANEALWKNDPVLLRLVLEELETPNQLIGENTPLTLAVLLGDEISIDKLLRAGADPNGCNLNGSTALTWATEIHLVKLLAKHGASAEFELPVDGWTSLSIACMVGATDRVKAILEMANGQAVLEQVDDRGMTPLAHATANGSIEVVRLLLRHGACVDGYDNVTGSPTPLQFAIEEDDELMVRELLNAGASVDLTCGLNRPPLEMAKDNPRIRGLLERARSEQLD